MGHVEGSFSTWFTMMSSSNRRFLSAGLLLALVSVSTGAMAQAVQKPHSACETAVVLSAPTHLEGVQKEYQWLKANHPNARIEEQSLIDCKGKPTDSFTLTDHTGQKIVVLFDLSGYWGKGMGL